MRTRHDSGAYLSRLRALSIFEGCSDDELERLDGLLSEVSVDSGRELLDEGTAGRQFVVIAEGIASVARAGEEVARLTPGSFFGEHSLLSRELRNATVTSVTPMRLFVFDRGEFQSALEELPTVAATIVAADRDRADAGADQASG